MLQKPVTGEEADFVADTVTYDPRTKLATATGTVRITYGPYVLNATRVTYNQVTGVFTANGSVELHEPNGNLMLAETLELKEKFKAGFASHLRALLTNDATIAALYAKRTADGITVYESAHYTACVDCVTKSGNPVWELASEQTTHDQNEHMLYHVNPRLKFAGHTVLGVPYWAQPDPTVKRKSGFLVPYFSHGATYGTGVTVPYFLVTSDSTDLTFRPKLTLKQGPIADVEWRQATATGAYSVRGYGLRQLNPDEAYDHSHWRGAATTEGRFKLNDAWSWGFDGTVKSDKTFLNEYDYNEDKIAQSDVFVTGLRDRDYFHASLLNFQSLDNSITQDYLPYAMPFVTGEHYFDEPVIGGEMKLKWSGYSLWREAQSTPFSPNTTVEHGTRQARAVGEVDWQRQMISDAGVVVTPFANLRGDFYSAENLPGADSTNETTARILPAAGFDARYPFIANTDWGQSIVSPVFQIVSAADETNTNNIGNEDAITLNFDHTSLFLTDRFTGLDRYEGGTRANIGLTYSFLADNGGFVRASAGESVHIAGRNSFVTGSGLEGSQSDLVAAILVQPWDELSLSYEVRAEEDLSRINRQEAQASLTFDSFSTELGYMYIAAEPNYGRLDTEQWAEASARVGLTDGWYAFGGLRYDLQNDRVNYRTAGVEFDCDCMNFKLAYTGKEDADTGQTDHRVMMSIDLATLGGTSVSSGF
ncbi:MAG: LPS assembly protein LptD [Hyphomicrobiales bacterium]